MKMQACKKCNFILWSAVDGVAQGGLMATWATEKLILHDESGSLLERWCSARTQLVLRNESEGLLERWCSAYTQPEEPLLMSLSPVVIGKLMLTTDYRITLSSVT